MFTKNNRTSLLRYWTARYLLIMFIGLIIIAVTAFYWINFNASEKRKDFVKLMADELADRIVSPSGQLSVDPVPRIFDRRRQSLEMEIHPLFFVLDRNKRLITGSPSDKFFNQLLPYIVPMLDSKQDVATVHLDFGRKFSFVKKKIQSNNETLGWIVILYQNEIWRQNREQLQFLLIMLAGLALLAWGVIYLITRKLAAPIRDVADAAKQIVSGDYNIGFTKEIKEKEIYELTESFKDMAARLRQLEAMRTELLAGVTHELKTPVASISGLVQAIKDDIVTGDEAREFLEICHKETQRLQKTVEDLLNFNSFAVGVIHVQKERLALNPMLQEMVYQWQIAQEDDFIQLHTDLPQDPVYAETDPARLQQILYNLLNNAKQAIDKEGSIAIRLQETNRHFEIDVKDSGAGIPPEEQPMIFERFFRGKNKKSRMRGLGLGLTFSKMLAKALGGDLILKESSDSGSIFTLLLPKSS